MNNSVYTIGSLLLNLSNNHDVDALVVVDSTDAEFYKREYVNGVDTVTCSTANIDRRMNFELPFTLQSAKAYIINYQLDKDIIKQDFPIEYHILDERHKYIELLNWIVDHKAANFVKKPGLNQGNCTKRVYHIAYVAFIMLNNSTILTAEQKAIIQKIHDRQMPQDYLDELAEIIKGLK